MGEFIRIALGSADLMMMIIGKTTITAVEISHSHLTFPVLELNIGYRLK